MSDYQVLLEDEALLVINKPSGLRTIPDGYQPSLPHLAGLLQERFGRVWVVHRLDKDTSGVILFARSAEAHQILNRQFEQREIRKEYHAIVTGMPEWESLTISFPLKIDGDRKHRTVIDHQAGKPAETIVRVLQRLGVFTLLAASPHTGYTHQIRAHLASVGLPLLRDPLYKSLQSETQTQVRAREIFPNLPIQRVALHAYQMTLLHPQTQQPLTIQAAYPIDFQHTLDFLQKP